MIPICEIRSKSLVGHYGGKEIQITFHLVNLAFPRTFYLIFIIYNNDENLLSEKLSELLYRYNEQLEILTVFRIW